MNFIWWLLAFHALGAVVAPIVARRIGARVLLLCAVVPAATLAWTVAVAIGGIDGDPTPTGVSWVPGLDLDLTVRIDAFALLWVGIISAIGVAGFEVGS